MGSNSFGENFVVTTWGESHGRAIGAVIDGCPPNLPLTLDDINDALYLRSPIRNNSPYTTPRKEPDRAEILSGVFQGKTTGAPISIIIYNKDARPQDYEKIENVYRPGHANFTYDKKYGHFDYRGGGRASARETASRVAAGAVAKKWLESQSISFVTFLKTVGSISLPSLSIAKANSSHYQSLIHNSPLFCPDPATEHQMVSLLESITEQGDSIGSIVECHILGLSPGIGDPIYRKIEARLASAMLSINASKGFEMGSGFKAAAMQGSIHNDTFVMNENGNITCETNHAGGVLAGISTGMPITFKTVFKPPSSIRKSQTSVTKEGETTSLTYDSHARHDACLGIRAVPVVEAMAALTITDYLVSSPH